jgi:hypothetical protein
LVTPSKVTVSVSSPPPRAPTHTHQDALTGVLPLGIVTVCWIEAVWPAQQPPPPNQAHFDPECGAWEPPSVPHPDAVQSGDPKRLSASTQLGLNAGFPEELSNPGSPSSSFAPADAGRIAIAITALTTAQPSRFP